MQAALRLESQATIDREFENQLSIKDNCPKLVVSYHHLEGSAWSCPFHGFA